MNFQWEEWLSLGLYLSLIETIGKALLVVVLALVGWKVANKISTQLFDSLGNKYQYSERKVKTLSKTINSLVGYVVFFIAAIMILGLFGIPTASILAGAGIIGLAVGFGAQGLVSDVVTGFFILLENQIEVGDYVTMGGYSGIVEEVGIRVTKVRSFDGSLHYIPNREIGSLTNHSRGNMRALVDMSISYEDDIDTAISVLQAACDQVRDRMPEIKEGPNVLGVQAFGSSDVVLRVIAKTENMQQWAVERELRKALKKALDDNGIEIPYPHQVYLTKQG
ncbi:mechanosensitive ion channel family protein [Ammoniphilus sp. CFH 90114]|uniref:mechanosensitive ion channel family protein n=1 Tax=Ammoniphilus sp. CFH 90114 TaxID=2493665 RepID=UPI00100F0CB7|nr:mechanosensitive ion channel family protein [Ammoniphilus sp. CFH 90114]RXT08750.1 mechanosensitive ion channel family protein [Ammoniphilus sp. CFH 90114]